MGSPNVWSRIPDELAFEFPSKPPFGGSKFPPTEIPFVLSLPSTVSPGASSPKLQVFLTLFLILSGSVSNVCVWF